MGSFFDIDGPFARFGNMLADIIIISLLWLVFSLPIITAGASTSAVFFITTRRISNNEGYIFRDFIKSFRQNFKQATVCWLIILAAAAILFFNIKNIDAMGAARPFILPMQLCAALELIMLSVYIFPLISRFELSIPEVFKSAFFMANKHLLTTISAIVLALTIIVISYLTILPFLAAMGCYAMLSSYLFMRIFKKYRPEMDEELP